MSENYQGNDQVIADFFKKSVYFILALIAVGFALYYFFKPQEIEKKVVETEYQAPVVVKTAISPPAVKFVEQAKQRGIDFIPVNGATGERFLPETMGNGLAFIDVDNDNDQDILFTNSTYWPWNEPPEVLPTQKLYINDGTGHFTDSSQAWNIADTFYATGVAVGDVNNDGFDDVFISVVGENRLYINQKGQSFALEPQPLNCSNSDWSTSSGFFDFDRDGDLDLVVLNYIEWSKELDLAADYKIDGIGRAYGPPSNFPGTYSCLFENTSDEDSISFKDVSVEKGFAVKNSSSDDYAGKSLALVIDDLNKDGWQDVIVANDTTRNFVFMNQNGESFKEQGEELGLAYNSSGKATGAMGVDTAFYKNTDDLAVGIGNFANEMTSFYVNQTHLGLFTDEAVIAGIGPQSRLALSFGLFFFDFDLDGRMDLFQTNGHVENDINKVQSAQQYAQKSQLFWNCGDQCERTYVAADNVGDINTQDIVGRAAAYADIDNDGDWDVLVNQVAAPPKLYINTLENKSWIGIRLKSDTPTLDAQVIVKTDKNTIKRSFNPTRSYQAQMQSDQLIGLGNDKLMEVMITSYGKQILLGELEINTWNEVQL